MFEDKTLTCRDCGSEFVFTEGEQKFYAEKGLMNTPSRCPACRQARKASNGPGRGSQDRAPRGDNAERVRHPVNCAECGKETTVPFVPKYDRPVYCSDCFEKQRVALSSR